MKYARVVDGLVYETFIPPIGVDISECFTPELVVQFIECSEEVEQNWIYDDNNFTNPFISE